MDGRYLLSKSVVGRRHVICEDACACRWSSNNESILFAVADGHGDPSCVRSARGAHLAVEVALRWLEDLSQNLGSELKRTDSAEHGQETRYQELQRKNAWELTWEERQEKEQERQLDALQGWGSTLLDDLRELQSVPPSNAFPSNKVLSFAESIVMNWRDAVREDLKNNPLSSEEITQARTRSHMWDRERPIHLYGTTLVAGALLPEALLLFAQGDGCCSVVYTDGTVVCPIPEDNRNVGNITTSLCDLNAGEAMARRFALVERRPNDPIACLLATDGVENSVMGEEGVKAFAQGVVLDAVRGGNQTNASQALSEALEQMSQDGAGDDATLAGFVDVERAATSVDALGAARDEIDKSMERRLNEDRLRSIQRARQYRKKRRQELEQLRQEQNLEIERKLQELDDLYGSLEREGQELERRQEQLYRQDNSQPDEVVETTSWDNEAEQDGSTELVPRLGPAHMAPAVGASTMLDAPSSGPAHLAPEMDAAAALDVPSSGPAHLAPVMEPAAALDAPGSGPAHLASEMDAPTVLDATMLRDAYTEGGASEGDVSGIPRPSAANVNAEPQNNRPAGGHERTAPRTKGKSKRSFLVLVLVIVIAIASFVAAYLVTACVMRLCFN